MQASATAEGYLSIPDLRKLAADGDYSVTQDVKMRGIVVSSVQDNNYYEQRIRAPERPESQLRHYAPHRRGALPQAGRGAGDRPEGGRSSG